MGVAANADRGVVAKNTFVTDMDIVTTSNNIGARVIAQRDVAEPHTGTKRGNPDGSVKGPAPIVNHRIHANGDVTEAARVETECIRTNGYVIGSECIVMQRSEAVRHVRKAGGITKERFISNGRVAGTGGVVVER